MPRTLYRAFLTVYLTLLLFVAVSSYVLAAHPDHAQAPDTITQQNVCTAHAETVQLAWFYKPPEPDENMSFSWFTRHFDTYILTKNDEFLLEQLHEADERPVLQYLHFDNIHDPCRLALQAQDSLCYCQQSTWNNQVAWNPTDVCIIRDHHPEWLLRDIDGNLMYNNDDLMVDLGNREWQDFWLERLQQSQQDGWDGVFIDNVATRYGIHRGEFVTLDRYPDDDAYRAATLDFLRYVREQYFDPQDKPLYANISVYWGHTPVYLEYLEYLDGTMDEFWAYPRTGYYTAAQWEDRLLRMEETLKRGKVAILVSQGEWGDEKRRIFGLASYLLLASDKTFFRYTKETRYPRPWFYEEYRWKLGDPVAPYTTDGELWRRSFTNGEVTVNPHQHTATITLHDADHCT